MPLPRFSTKTFTWGTELELGDVRRALVIPVKYGAWEYAETDIVNVLPGPYQYVACDPLGVAPPVGGEINTYPSYSCDGQLELIDDFLSWLRRQGETPTTNCISHTHVHVHVPGLRESSAALRRLTRYIVANQAEAIRCIHAFDPVKVSSAAGRAYLKWDCGRPMPHWMGANIEAGCRCFADFIRLQCCGKDGVSMGRPFRYAINTYCLKHTNTIEFRLFRGSLDLIEIESCLRFAERFLDAALNGGPSVAEILAGKSFAFPLFRYSRAEAEGWQRTKWETNRGKKERRYIPLR